MTQAGPQLFLRVLSSAFPMVVIRFLLLAFFIYITATVAAFIYLKWYEAILASGLTFMALCFLGMRLIRYKIRNVGRMALKIFDVKSQVLHGASVDVHSVRAVTPPITPDDSDSPEQRDIAWYEIEFTLFPDARAAGRMSHWDLDDLALVPFTAVVSREPGDPAPEFEISPTSVKVVENGEAYEPDGSKFHGPQRLRMVAGLPRGILDWKFRYYFESFGHVRVPAVGPRLLE